MRVTLVLTHDCNLACDYCYTGEKFAKAMSDEVAEQALQLAFSQPGEGVMVSFFGGEPMLEFERMQRFAKRARELGPVDFQVTTNVTILSDNVLSFLKDYDFQVGLSVDGLGDDNRHRPFAGGRSSAELVWRNLEKAAILPKATVLMVVNPDTLEGLPRATERVRELGYRTASLLPHMEATWDGPARAKAHDIYARLAEWTHATLQSDRPLWLSPFADQFCEGLTGRCGFGEDDLAVSPSGNLYPCARLVGTDRRADLRLGHVAEGVSPELVKRVRARARAKMEGCGAQGCQCAALMPGKTLTQLENTGFFQDLIRRSAAAV